MGQYFKQYMCSVTGKEYFLDAATQFGYGWKLTEHARWYNSACNAAAMMAYLAGHVIVWAGDYSEADLPYGQISKKDSERILKRLWSPDIKEADRGIYEAPAPKGFTLDGKFLADHTKKEYIDCDAYKKSVVSYDKYAGGVMHPLPLLTCAGNGENSGDYCGSGMDIVGSWCGDVISVEDKEPDGYKKLTCLFLEGTRYIEIKGGAA